MHICCISTFFKCDFHFIEFFVHPYLQLLWILKCFLHCFGNCLRRFPREDLTTKKPVRMTPEYGLLHNSTGTQMDVLGIACGDSQGGKLNNA